LGAEGLTGHLQAPRIILALSFDQQPALVQQRQ
jgi:hypothetical protein